ncbi:DUF2752 domain-containing protein [Rhodococcus erythropolis]|jgi:hypothetical protein|uniref:DUF2752 domain-containing protein n=3 Tax=Actinomycetes TaxID=1760 RepID=A0ABV5XT48_9NOCA|nr:MULTISPECIES: DUF2752 domain-containing protein [unclassified Rhodococcus (in: high G+C Gram-positive bacteria)]NHP18284.1 DUF2752 domain-containing protein [Rhodococcus sp. IC4_135]MBJ7481646.1 DUF2752 domain-containing protein [Rhodococcus sp. (in: high G+C Gram-positive bacteria)]MDI9959302.1 DUF2752 domain-containing protein [Rhodococcus sp. IEGM 1237]MDI9965123.1 DUF2752 domain-containing protein [Rhodococcus sp. IEGM 1251]MDV8127559.1 DUF2752 domain-containing protein [Rhodococcus sp.
MELEAVARRRRALAAPVGVAAVAVTAAAVLHFRDPHSAGSYGVCPMYALTGLWCPACGGLRAVNDLTNLDLGAAVSSNVLIVPFIAVLVIAWIGWTVRRWKGTRDRMIVLRPTVTIVVLGVLVAFTVVRNTPWGSWLAPA